MLCVSSIEKIYERIPKLKPVNYGKGGKEVKEEDIVVLKDDAKIEHLNISNSFGIYEKKKDQFLTYDQILNLIVSVLLLTLLIIKFLINNQFQTDEQKNFEQLISNFCFAFIASYIFYRIVIKRKEKIKNRESYAIICGLTDTLLDHGKDVLNLVAKGANKQDEIKKLKNIDRETLKRLCSQTDITKTIDGNNLNIGGLIILQGVKKVNFFIDKIYNYMPFLEGEYIKHINRIQNCTFSRNITVIPYKKGSDLKGFSNDIYDFLELLNSLEKYNNGLKSKYLKNYERTY